MIVKRTVLLCDKCGAQLPFEGEDAAEVRQFAREAGWVVRDADICNVCLDRVTRRHRPEN